ncbi:MAG: hypothetical protein ABIS09_06185 [Sphingomicrobium sp.]
MMRILSRRGEELAHAAKQRRIDAIATQLKAMFGSGAVEVEEARVLVRGKGMIKRWLIDPQLRFLK